MLRLLHDLETLELNAVECDTAKEKTRKTNQYLSPYCESIFV